MNLNREELSATIDFLEAQNSADIGGMLLAQAELTRLNKKRSSPIGEETPLIDLGRDIVSFCRRLVADKDADVGVVMSKVLGEITGVVRRAAEQLSPLPPKAVVVPQLLTLQIFKRSPLPNSPIEGAFEEVHDRTMSFGPGVIKIGSLSTSRIVITGDPKVARMHAVIEFDLGSVRIIDLGSVHGTIVNGERVSKAELKDGYVVRLGNTMLGVSLTAPPPPV